MSKLNSYIFCYTKYSLDSHIFVFVANVQFNYSDFLYVDVLEKYKIWRAYQFIASFLASSMMLWELLCFFIIKQND